MRPVTTALILLAALLSAGTTMADWEPNEGDKVEMKSAAAIEKIRAKIPRSQMYFDNAYGYAILPSVSRIGFGFGGATGKGIVVENGSAVGKTRYWQFTSGIQAGAKNFSMIVFFKDKEALDYFKSSKTQFMGQAGLTIANLGIEGTPAYNEGVAIVTMTRFGLMGEFTVSGAKFAYKPYSEES